MMLLTRLKENCELRILLKLKISRPSGGEVTEPISLVALTLNFIYPLGNTKLFASGTEQELFLL